MKKIIPVIIPFFLLACNTIPSEVKRVVSLSGSNRQEIDKVIAHFKKSGDVEKTKATYFLLKNMANKFYYTSQRLRDYDEIFVFLDSLRREGKFVGVISPVMKKKWHDLNEQYGSPFLNANSARWDYKHLTASQIINHIEQAFRIRETTLAKELTFEQFCKYILPYRIGTERFEPWNEVIYSEYKKFRDTTTAKTRYDLAARIHRHLRYNKGYYTNHAFLNYPFDMPYSKLDLGRRGICRHFVFNTALIMRANGLPVAIDYIPLHGNRSSGHHWNVLIQEDGTEFPFDAVGRRPFGMHESYYKIAKVFRKTFEIQPIQMSEDALRDLPSSMIRTDRIDVTDKYTDAFDIEVDLKYPSDRDNTYAVICTFNNFSWRCQTSGEIIGEKAYFKQMGSGIVYVVMYYRDGKFSFGSDPFILSDDGKIKYIKTKGGATESMRIVRKYPLYPHIKDYYKTLLGGRIQGANYPDFRDSVTIAKITYVNDGITNISVTSNKRFQYIRFISGSDVRTDLAELRFYGKISIAENEKMLKGKSIGYPDISSDFGNPFSNVFDGDLNTYFTARNDLNPSWAGMELGDKYHITTVEVAPRSDTNFIIKGRTYDLSYWNGTDWTSLEKKKADGSALYFEDVPSGMLYLLRDIAGGKEQRIFTYEDGKQKWW